MSLVVSVGGSWKDPVVAKGFLTGMDIDQSCLLPVDARDWLAADHPVWFFRDVVARLDLSGFERRYARGGAGRAAYDPRLLVGVLLYGYANGQRSSRTLERLCGQDLAFRVLAGGLVPDHTTIARFRAGHDDDIAAVFAQVLVMCAEVGLVNLEVVAIDGTKIAASASGLRNATREQVQRQWDAARRLADTALAEAADTDAAENDIFGVDGDRGDRLPRELVDSRARLARIEELQQVLKDREDAAAAKLQAARDHAARHLAEVADPDQSPSSRAPRMVDPVDLARARLTRERAVATRRQAQTGQVRKPVEDYTRVVSARARLADAQTRAQATPGRDLRRMTKPVRVNTTDPQSQTMTSAKGWVQGYNTQLAVSADQVILAVQVTNNPLDIASFTPTMAAAVAAATCLAPHRRDGVATDIGVIVADAGYCSAANLDAPGPDRIIATSKAHKLPPGPPDHDPPPDAGSVERMTHRIRTDEARATYRHRATTVEPVNGHLKTITAMRQMSRRGLIAAQAEVTLAATVLNLAKLRRATT